MLFQMATPSLKTRTEWCLSLRSSERTTPPNRGPTSGEPPANPEPRQPSLMAIFEAKEGEEEVQEFASCTDGRFGHEYERTEESDI